MGIFSIFSKSKKNTNLSSEEAAQLAESKAVYDKGLARSKESVLGKLARAVAGKSKEPRRQYAPCR